MTTTPKINVLLCAPYGGVAGGISRWTAHFVTYYEAQHESDFVLSVFPTNRSSSVGINPPAWSRIKHGTRDYYRICRDYGRELDQARYDILHLASSASWGLIKDLYMLRKAKKRGLKTIVHFHFGRIPELAETKTWEWYLLLQVIRMADRVVVIDRQSYDTLLKAGFDHVDNLPNPLAPAVAAEIEKQGPNVNREQNLILYAGHVIKTKGIYELVEACKAIDGIRLRMIGAVSPEIRDELLRMAEKNGDTSWIEICGERPYASVIDEMMRCTVFALPTYTEGFPNVILESMASGCPIVASAVGAIPEMIPADETQPAGLLIPPKDPEALRQALSTMLRDDTLREQCGCNARIRVNRLYHIENIWRQMTAIWHNTI